MYEVGTEETKNDVASIEMGHWILCSILHSHLSADYAISTHLPHDHVNKHKVYLGFQAQNLDHFTDPVGARVLSGVKTEKASIICTKRRRACPELNFVVWSSKLVVASSLFNNILCRQWPCLTELETELEQMSKRKLKTTILYQQIWVFSRSSDV
jgi:hypothetical protein